jgi:hypothetical protein
VAKHIMFYTESLKMSAYRETNEAIEVQYGGQYVATGYCNQPKMMVNSYRSLPLPSNS